MDEGCLVRAVYNFQTDVHGELPLSVGDVIQVGHRIDKQWLYGYCGSSEGAFPSGFVIEITLPNVKDGQQVFAATADFPGQEAGDLSFRKGDIIVGLHPVDANWWQGDCNGNVGIFPLTHVWGPDMSKLITKKTSKSVNLVGRVKMDMKAQLPGEIDLSKNDIVHITEVVDKNWYRGECNGRIGTFPLAFITLISQDEANKKTNNSVPNFPLVTDFAVNKNTSPKDQSLTPKENSFQDLFLAEVYENSDSLGYDSLNSGITPYGRTLYPFAAQFPNELSFKKGELVTLIQHINDEWIEGELNGKIGRFPTNFIKIIVDCPENNNSLCNNGATKDQFAKKDVYVFPNDSYGRVLYDFTGEMEGDLTLKAGDTVTLLRQLNKDWYEAITDDGNVGICPANFLEIIGSSPHGTPNEHQKPVPSLPVRDNWNGFSKNQPSNNSFNFTSQSLDKTIANNLASLDFSSKRENTVNKSEKELSPASQTGYGTWPSLRQPLNLTNEKNEKLRWSLPCSGANQLREESEKEGPAFQRTRSLTAPRRPAPPAPLSRQSSTVSISSENANINRSKLSSSLRLKDEGSLAREAEVTRKKEEEAKRKEEEKRKKMKEQMECVILEMVQTEKDYLQDLRVCHDTFLKNLPNESFAADVSPLFGNLDEVVDVSSRLLSKLQSVNNSRDTNRIGECFITMAEEMKEAYGVYCRNHDDTHELLSKLEAKPEIKRYLDKGLAKMKETTNCFDLPSVLIKPVQRILKYPLLLNELVKCTEESHPNRANLLKAVNVMTDVANDINEFKRRKDLVFKYRKEADISLSTRIAKINMHSVWKKYARFGVKVSSSLGLSSVSKDEDFDKLAKKFNSLEKAMKIYLKNLSSFMDQLKECSMNALHMSEDIGLYFQENSKQPEVDQLRTTQRLIATQYFEDFNVSVERNVTSVLNQLLQTYHVPNKLVQKRYDKFLDYSACKTRLERNKDPNKVKSLENEQQLAKSNYEALNGQLLEELPKLCSLSMEIFQDCLLAFLRARKVFIGRCAKQMLTLMELPLLLGSSRDIFETFQVKHNLIVDQLTNLTLVPKSLFPAGSVGSESSSAKRLSQASSSPVSPPVGTLGRRTSQSPQSPSQRVYVQNQYSPEALYCAAHPFVAVDVLDITLEKGDVVGVIKKQDPMGQSHKWFVDNGVSKGFVPAKFLSKFSVPGQPSSQSPPPVTPAIPSARVRRRPPANCTEAVDSSLPSYEDAVNQARMGKGTAAPSGSRSTLETVDASFHRYYEIPDGEQELQEQGDGVNELINFENRERAESAATNRGQRYANLDEFDPYSPVSSSGLYDNVPSDAGLLDAAGHRYEMIPEDGAESPSRETVIQSSPRQLGSPSSPESTNQETLQYFYAIYKFDALGPNQLSLSLGQVVLVQHKHDLNGNKDWWFVEDRHGNLGYVPAAYLTPYKR